MTRHDWRSYSLGDAVSAGAEIERRRPARGASIESDVAVPGLQAAISGLLCGIGALGLGIAVGWAKPLPVALATTITVMLLSWLILLGSHREGLWEVERITGVDVDGDGEIGPPPPPPTTTRVELIDTHRGAIRWVDVPLSDDQLERLARALLVRRLPLSRRQLSDDDVLSEEVYGAVLDAFLDGGLAAPKGKSRNAGVELTGAGRAFLRQYLD